MSENHQDTANHNSVTTETKLWLPPSYINGKAPTPTPLVPPNPKKRGINWGFSDKSFWEWIILIGTLLAALGAIAIPFVVTIIGLNFTQQQAQLSNVTNIQQHQTDAQIALDQQRETTLEAYVSDLQDLLLNYNLRNSKPNDEVRGIARARTLFALRQLDGIRKGFLIDFIYQAHLIQAPKSSSDNLNPILSLANADLSGMILYNAYLIIPGNGPVFTCGSESTSNFEYLKLDGVDFNRADLSRSNISCISMEGANLFGVNLNGASLVSVDLTNADLSGIDLRCSYSSIPSNCTHVRSVLFNNADLYYADLVGTDFSSCSFADANLSDAYLSYTNLIGAYLVGANLNDADLFHAKISSQKLESASSLKGARMPDGSIHP